MLSFDSKKIYTDGLRTYRSLIPSKIHKVITRCTNKIERMNLSLRTHLKHLSRKTICYLNHKKCWNIAYAYIAIPTLIGDSERFYLFIPNPAHARIISYG